MMKRSTTIFALAFVALVASSASAQTSDHFARQRQEAIARQAATQQQFSQQQHGGANFGVSHHGSPGHWGGPTTYDRFYNPSSGYGGYNNTQFYQVNPYGYGVGYGSGYGVGYGGGYGLPNYGFYGGGYPYYGAPHCGLGGSGVYIHREIHLGR